MSREIDEIKAKIDLVDLMGEYIKLIPAGANYKALCPFHNEKTPSLMISRPRQIWKCFGCGEGGDIFDFLMKMENLEFGETLRVLAKKAGVTLSNTNITEDNQKNKLYDICQLAARYWHKILLESSAGAAARDYLKNRGLTEETIEDFQLGYAADSWDNLLKFLSSRKFKEAEIFAAGLTVKKNQGSGFYDRFRDRITFPILDLHGRTVGFGARTMKADEGAKYINSPQTQIYNKSAILYGFYQAKAAIKSEDLVILVEGYMDVIPSHQAGVKNVVAISGTALTPEQIKILKRYSNNLAIALDMDAAGRQAAERSIDLALGEEMNVRVITLPQGKDPGECVKNSPDDWRQAIAAAQPAMDYFFAVALGKWDVGKPEDKKAIGKFLLEKISQIGNPIEKDHWIRELAKRLDVSENVLRELLAKVRVVHTATAVKPLETAKIGLKRPQDDRQTVLLKKMLGLGFIFPKLFVKLATAGLNEYLALGRPQELYKKIVLFYTKNVDPVDKLAVDNSTSQNNLLDFFAAYFRDDEETTDFLNESFLFGQDIFSDLDAATAGKEFDALLKMSKSSALEQSINSLKQDLERAEKSGDRDQAEEIYRRLQDLIAEKNH